ncbi:MAG: UDP-N-acetylmuramoyl-L-alanyl-D-glutamate--2,6-diaminopimelate ligase [Myxococcales bacterium]|nr:UDP-N-acetylmuramoyl-L-alanyl-D-glutamate--2,6-diaminopimelate ligase [Myxococcales bacterium]
MSLAALAERLGGVLHGDGAVRVGDLRHDSRAVEPGDLFVALPGAAVDGLAFAAEAVTRGAVAILAERAPSGATVPFVVVPDARVALGPAAAAVHGHPSERVRVAAVTGTNGKTTTVELVCAALARAGRRPASMGTLGIRFAGAVRAYDLNTPEADATSRLLAELRDAGATELVLEATSHGLAEHRLDGLALAVGAFTNLTHDHLDLHGSFEAYGRAKARLFRELAPAVAVIDVDDPFGATLARELGAEPGSRVLTVSVDGPAALRAVSPCVDAAGIRARIETPSGSVELRSGLLGRHNLSNLLVALGMALGLGLEPGIAAEALSECPAPPGRLERCDAPGDDVVVLVDYAHSPDALDKALSAARLLGRGKLWCVFGCGGARDRTKRAPMGEMAARRADVLVVTSDNPRSESPAAIAEAVLEGVARAGGHATVELDRAAAIALAVSSAAPGDVVVVAGKGHETEQVVGAEHRPFDDRVEVRRGLAGRRAGG